MADGVFSTEFIKGVIDRVVKNLGYNEVKELQFKVMLEILNGRDVFAVLPTGYGKSLCYGCLPLVKSHPHPAHIKEPSFPSEVTMIFPSESAIFLRYTCAQHYN